MAYARTLALGFSVLVIAWGCGSSRGTTYGDDPDGGDDNEQPKWLGASA